ncbi:MAG: LysR family transcriptional regulator [Saccharofermentans sp.]|nr:LysR family transcriptional regulator [Saccharofermentans sp.]
MMNCLGLSCMRVVLALSVNGNKEEVAKQLNITPDHVSKEVRIFENRIGVTVFEKNGNRLDLTADGSRIILLHIAYDRQLHMLIESRNRDQLRIGFSNSTLACAFLHPITSYLNTHPPCKPAPNVYPYEELTNQLSLGLIDIAVTSASEMMVAGQTYRYSGEYELNMLTMKNDPVCVSESFITPSMAGLKPLITSEDLYKEVIANKINYDNISVGYVNDMLWVLALTYTGHGCGIIPYIPQRSYDVLPFTAMPFYPALRAGFTISVRKDTDALARAEPFIKMLTDEPSHYHMIFK